MYRTISAFLLSALFFNSFSQQATNFRNYTDMKNISDIKTTSQGIWAATTGGGFFYNTADGSFSTINKVDGLNSVSLSAAAIDNSGKIWFGSSDGTISIYDPSTKNIKTILDIYNSGRSSNKINDMKVSGDTVIVSHDFGVSLVDANNLAFFDTFIKFGSLTSNIKVNNTLRADLFYVSTQFGLAVQKAGSTNLTAPESWNVYTTANGLPSNNITKVIQYKGSIIAATDAGLSVFNGSSWAPYLPQFNNNNVNDILVSGDSLLILSNNIIYSYKNNSVIQINNSSNQLTKLALSKDLGVVAASSKGIFIVSKPGKSNYIIPNGPAANQFPSITVDGNGNFWSASGKDGRGVGFYKYDGANWTNYNISNTPSLSTNDYYSVYAAPNNIIYLGSWGKGYSKVNGSQITSYDSTGTGLVGIPASLGFLVISGFGVDPKNNLWVLNYWPGDGNTLNALSTNNTWYHFNNPAEAGLSLEFHFNLVIDQNDTKWYNVLDSRRAGLYYFNENGTLTNNNDNVYGYLNTTSGLNSNIINSLVVDKRGDLWVGTSVGVNVITNLNTISASGSGSLKISSVFILRQQTINCLAVDALNRKWVGTNEGLLLVNSDGSSLLAAYNTKNSPLLSDQIVSLAVDQNSGTVYVGTNAGITAFKTTAENPLSSFTNLFFYPNPFKLNSGSNQLTIEGLVKDSDIKILTISGKLVRQFSSPGGRVAFWDGRDDNGNLVGSGIYIVVAYDKDGNNIITGKVAILRK